MNNIANLNDMLNEETTRLCNAVWLWCVQEGYNEISSGGESCFIKNQKTTGFVLEKDKTKGELLSCIDKAKQKYDYIFVVIDDSSKRRELIKIIPEYCGIFCNSNAFGLGWVTQILRQPGKISKKGINIGTNCFTKLLTRLCS